MTEETKTEEVKEPAQNPADIESGKEKKEETKEVVTPAKFKDIVEKIEKMSVLELSELVKFLEEKFGVSAQAVAVAPAGGAGAGEEAEEKSSFTVELKSSGDQKIQVIKVLRDALALGLKEAKELSDKAPVIVKEGIDKKGADELKEKLETAGATVELK